MTRLLVSVRCLAEAQIALSAGVDILDWKEPARGSLGRPDRETLQLAREIPHDIPRSIALGELAHFAVDDGLDFVQGFDFVKWGLASLAGRDWSHALRRIKSELAACSAAQLVPVAYADSERAEAPPWRAVCDWALSEGSAVLLVDTFVKDGRRLMDWLPPRELATLATDCRKAGVRLALAGSLDLASLPIIREVGPDIVAVRGAVCEGDRQGSMSADRISEFGRLLSR